jgi:2-dehydropantoate 2-reductase
MKTAVIGAGGVGGYFGGKLAAAGIDVTFVARGEHYKAIKNNGLLVKSIKGDFKVDNVQIVDSANKLASPELIILAVKAWQIKEIVPDLKKIITAGSVILPLENGISITEELGEQVNMNNIIGGLCRIISKIESPGVINHIGVEPYILFGEWNNSQSERVLRIKELFDKAGIKNKIPTDINAELWKKFISICVSGFLALTRSTYGEVRQLKETRQSMADLMKEIITLSQEVGIKLEPDFLDKSMAFIDSFPHDSTSSLTRDVWEGKPSEIDYQNGYVSKLGARLGVPTPINTLIYNCILPIERRARRETKNSSMF